MDEGLNVLFMSIYPRVQTAITVYVISSRHTAGGGGGVGRGKASKALAVCFNETA